MVTDCRKSRPTSVCIFLILAIGLVSCGCISPQQPENQAPVVVPEDTGSPAGAPVVFQATTAGITVTPIALQDIRPRPSLIVERGKSFTMSGSVSNRSITAVRVWLINRSMTVRRVPVMADGTFTVLLGPDDTAVLPRDYTAALVIQYPLPPENFTVGLDSSTGHVVAPAGVPPRVLEGLNNRMYYPSTLADYLNQAVMDYGGGNTCDIYFPDGVDASISLDPVLPGPPGSMTVTGNTSLPAGTPLFVTVATMNAHPTPKNYDFSHEIADGTAVVRYVPGGINRFAGTIDTSRLNTGRYLVIVETRDDSLQAHTDTLADIIATVPSQPGNYINWSALSLPPLAVNRTMTPVMLSAGWRIVPPGTSGTNNEIPYGSIIDCAPDGICRAFDAAGVQYLAVFNSNEAHSIEVPNGAMIDTESTGNVSRIMLDGRTVLVKIDEVPRGK